MRTTSSALAAPRTIASRSMVRIRAGPGPEQDQAGRMEPLHDPIADQVENCGFTCGPNHRLDCRPAAPDPPSAAAMP